jgi:hypothetical protein
MADERDFELLDDYITNRLSEADRSALERKLHADPDLQHEYALQQRLVQGIKYARAAELKSMLNKVPVPSNNPGNSLVTKIILGTVASLMIAAAGYWYFTAEENKAARPDTAISKQERKPEKPAAQPEAQAKPEQQQAEQQPAVVQKPTVQADKNQTSAGTEHSKPSLAKKPDPLQAPGAKSERQNAADGPVLDVFDPATEEHSANDNDATSDNETRGELAKSTLIVEADRENGQYTFHYQFIDGKLLLFGPFEKNLYEIMEFFANEKRTVFLYYNNRYYLLAEADANVRPLEPITDPVLLKKLKEYRSSK